MRAANHANRFSPSIRTKTCGASQIATEITMLLFWLIVSLGLLFEFLGNSS
jgi:hypothetical protein